MVIRKLLLTSAFALVNAAMAFGQYSYWFDYAPAITAPAVQAGGGTLELDASALPEGRHTVHVRYVDANGASTTASKDFLRVYSPAKLTGAICIDGIPATPTGGGAGSYSYDFDASALPMGLHTVTAQLMGSDGAMSTDIVEGLFMRVPMDSEMNRLTCYYTIDGSPAGLSTGSIVNGLLHADVDAASLADGLHTVHFMLVGEPPLSTRAYSAYFIKIPQGGIGIKSYSYWINDDTDSKVSINLDNPETPASIVSLLPVKEYPFRSSSYHFAVEDGMPTIYPVNDFNMYVSDNRGYMKVSSTPFHDSRRKVEFTQDVIETGVAKKTGAFKNNEVKVYAFDAAYGDSLILSADRAASVEVYDNTGEKLLTTNGIDIVKGAGTHARTDGRHYAVVHDAARNFSTALRVDKIDRFALLEHAPTSHANEGLMIMSLAGNGFESLREVRLKNENAVICSDSIVTTGNSRANALFDLGYEAETECGVYGIEMIFKAEDHNDTVLVADALKLEKLRYADPVVEVNLKQAVRELPHLLNVSVTNVSNASLWALPLNIAYDNLEVELYRRFTVAGVPEKAGKAEPLYYDTSNLLGKGVEGRYIPLYIPWLKPGETKTLTFALKTSDKSMNFYAWCGLPISQEVKQYLPEDGARNAPARARRSNFNYNRLNDLQGAAGEVGDAVGGAGSMVTAGNLGISIGSAIGGIVLIGGNNSFKAWMDAYPGLLTEDDLPYSDVPDGMTPGAILNGAGILPNAFGDALDNSLRPRNQNNAENDNPNPAPCPLNIPRPCDPNEMRGYVAQSGSKHVGLATDTLGYTIEFENEPEVATAPASYIRIENQLNAELFDCASFKAKAVTIGRKSVDLRDAEGGVVTLDMRPDINSIASVSWKVSAAGLLTVEINTLDPLTMDAAEDPWNGVLPVNYDGNGIGEFEYTVGLKEGLPDSTRIENAAHIVFNTENPIATDTWVNVTDYSRPTGRLKTVKTADNIIFEFDTESDDKGAGVWYRKLYGQQAGTTTWTLLMDGIDADKFVYKAESVQADMYYTVLVVDKAGNTQEETVLAKIMGDTDSNHKVDAADTVMLVDVSLGNKADYDTDVADINGDGRIDVQDVVTCAYIYLKTGVRQERTRKYPKNK